MILKYKKYDIFYTTDGNPKNTPIVILNGIMMSTKSWEIFKKTWSEDNYLIRFDMIDQGESSSSINSYNQSIQVDVLNELLKELNIDVINIIGISYGASIALQYSIKYPDKVDKLVLANGVAKTSPWLKHIGDGWNEVALSRNGEAYYNITIPYIYSPQFYTKNLEWMMKRKQLLIPIFSDPVFLDRMIRLTKSAETHDTVKELHKLKANTLIISSEQDYLTPVYEQEFLHNNITNSKLVIIPNCGHASMYEVPELFASLTLGHINNKEIPKLF